MKYLLLLFMLFFACAAHAGMVEADLSTLKDDPTLLSIPLPDGWNHKRAGLYLTIFSRNHDGESVIDTYDASDNVILNERLYLQLIHYGGDYEPGQWFHKDHGKVTTYKILLHYDEKE